MSVDRGSVQPQAAAGTTPRLAKRLSNVAEADQQEQNNVNFSRPRSSYTPAPAKQYTHGTGSWFSGAADARPKTADAAAGAKRHTVNGTDGERASSAVYDAADSTMVYDANSRTFVRKPRDRPLPQPEPPSPTVPSTHIKPVTPGSYDPHTRQIAPTQRTASENEKVLKPKPKPALQPVETQLEPPPRNPARNSPSGSTSPSSLRAAGYLHKQPSVVREDREGEEEAAATDSSPKAAQRTPQTSSPTFRSTQTAPPAKSYSTPSHQRSTSLDIPRPQSTTSSDGGLGRGTSPQRSAHFSISPVIEAHRHVPPPRDVSPAKSAMKYSHSPSSSVRAVSPLLISSSALGSKGMGVGSDAGSDAFIDDPNPGAIRKVRARVKFDKTPKEIDVAGAAAAQPKAIANVNLTPVSPTRSRSPVDEGTEEYMMKPRPALPSFGSVRRERGGQVMAEKVTEMPPDRNGMGMGMGSSADAVVGRIFATDAGARDAPLPPESMSKEAVGEESEAEDAAVEHPVGSRRRVSVDEKAIREEKEEKVVEEPEEQHKPIVKDFAVQPPAGMDEPRRDGGGVPAINLLPPTPGTDEESKRLGEADEEQQEEVSPKPKRSMEAFSVPGSWEESDDKDVAAPTTQPTHTPGPTTTTAESPEQRLSPTLNPIDEDSDDSAAFSDAAEDLSDLDDGGFASLDAIASSPVVPYFPSTSAEKGGKGKGKVMVMPESPTKIRAAEGEEGDWSQATAYWSQLSRQQREQIEKQHFSDEEDEGKSAVAGKPRKKVKKRTAGVGAAGAVVGAGVAAERNQSAPQPIPPQQRQAPPQRQLAQPPAQPAMKKSMRTSQAGAGGPAPAPADGEVHMRRSMRGPAPRQPPQQQQPRPQSEYVPQPRGALQKRNIPPRPMSAGGPAPQQQQPRRMEQSSSVPTFPVKSAAPISKPFTEKLQRKITDDGEDSDSSFKKRRKASVSTVESSGRYNMRKSLRAGSVDEQFDARPSSPTPAGPAKRGGGAFSIRSLSPSGSFMGGAKKRENLRTSLRSGSVDAGPKRTTLRAAPPPSSGGRGNGTARAAPPSAPRKSALKSRFAPDSDDEDEDGRPSRSFFRSRFADSDDEDDDAGRGVMKADLTPVRGIPRRKGQEDGDSTDLEGEDDGGKPRKAGRKGNRAVQAIVPSSADVDKAMEAARRKLGIGLPTAVDGAKENKEGTALSQGSLRTAETPEPKSRIEDVQAVGASASPAEPEKKRRGFMGSFLRRNRASSASIQGLGSNTGSPAPASPVAAPTTTTTSPPPQPQPQTSKPEEPAAPASPSVAKLVRRNSNQPRFTRGNSNMSSATAPPTSGRGILRNDSDNWPLPPVPKITANGVNNAERPNTSDGAGPEPGSTTRPDLAPRSQSGQLLGQGQRVRILGPEDDQGSVFTANTAGERVPRVASYSKRTGKKKKFQMLRRAFGLDD